MCKPLWAWLFKGVAGHPPPSGCPERTRDDEEVGGVGSRQKKEGVSVLRSLTPSSQSSQATMLPENSP